MARIALIDANGICTNVVLMRPIAAECAFEVNSMNRTARLKLTLFAKGPLAGTCLTILSVDDLDASHGPAGIVYIVRTECCGSVYELTHKEVSRKLQKSRQAKKEGRPMPVCNRCKHRTKHQEEQAATVLICSPNWPAPPLALSIVQQRQWWPR